MSEEQRKMAEIILSTLQRQKFADFYSGDFDKFISGDSEAKSKQEILEQIVKLFQL